MRNTSLISRRKELGLKQWQVAEKADISYRHYQNIEAGKNTTTVETAISIAKVLCLPVTDLFGAPKNN